MSTHRFSQSLAGTQMSHKEKGPLIYENWKQWDSDPQQESVAIECPLYTDVQIPIAPRKCGPYEVYPLHCGSHVKFAPRIVLTSTIMSSVASLDEEQRSINRTDASHYHGGYIYDEMAALISLCEGIRINPGLESRIFDEIGGVRGRPLGFGDLELPHVASFMYRDIIPSLSDARGSYFALIESLPGLSAEHAAVLIKASRLYQDAMWIVESQPHLSWVLLVSAVETVASYWHKERASKSERLKQFKPKLVERLFKEGGDDLVRFAADQLTASLGATRKFCDFLLKFRPDPLSLRPENERDRVSWEDDVLEKSFKKIYSWRSQALHSGIHFPSPMCSPPDPSMHEGHSRSVDNILLASGDHAPRGQPLTCQ